MQNFNKKICWVEFSIPYQEVNFECVLALKLKVNWLLDN